MQRNDMAESEIHDAAWSEREYNPRVTVAETPALVAAWPVRAAETRARRPFLADLRYGDHPREILDLYRARDARGAFVFVHGGYWRSFTKVETAWIADGFLDQGISVAMINYPLCPEVTVADIARSVRRAFVHLHRSVLDAAERAAIVVSGHSAGGYLAADLVATDWTAHDLPASPFQGALPVSGIYELAPLIPTSMNEQIRLTPETAAAWSLGGLPPPTRCRLALAVGGDEPGEFHRQASALAAAWPVLLPKVVPVPATNHFTVLDSLAAPDGILNRLAMDMLTGR
jgi:arylformamidase